MLESEERGWRRSWKRLRLPYVMPMWLNKAQSPGEALKYNFDQEVRLLMPLMCITSLYLLNMNINQNIYDVLIAFWLILLKIPIRRSTADATIDAWH